MSADGNKVATLVCTVMDGAAADNCCSCLSRTAAHAIRVRSCGQQSHGTLHRNHRPHVASCCLPRPMLRHKHTRASRQPPTPSTMARVDGSSRGDSASEPHAGNTYSPASHCAHRYGRGAYSAGKSNAAVAQGDANTPGIVSVTWPTPPYSPLTPGPDRKPNDPQHAPVSMRLPSERVMCRFASRGVDAPVSSGNRHVSRPGRPSACNQSCKHCRRYHYASNTEETLENTDGTPAL